MYNLWHQYAPWRKTPRFTMYNLWRQYAPWRKAPRSTIFGKRFLYFKLYIVHCTLHLIPYTLCLVMASCQNEVVPKKKSDPLQFKQTLEKVNKYEVEKQSDEIDQYVFRHDWQMKKTGTGLRYMFLKRGNGIQTKSGDVVKVNYKIVLLDGTECYSSAKDGPIEFTAEGDNIESGLHEAVLLMQAGDKAKFILPFYMAHGLRGDEDKIPPLSAIVVDLELLEVK